MDTVSATGQIARPIALPDTRRNLPPPATESSTQTSARAFGQAQFNGAVLKASLEVSISTANEPLQLVFRSAIDHLNEILSPEFGPDAIQNAVNQDNTPEGTAGRIVSLATGFFDAFATQRPSDDKAQQLKDFIAVIGRGIEQGFAEARDILKGLNVLQGGIASNIDRTQALVKQGLDAFAAGQLSAVPS